MPQIKTLQVGAHCPSWGPFTYIQDHLMPQIKTLQVGAHCPSWGPFTYIQDQLIWSVDIYVYYASTSAI